MYPPSGVARDLSLHLFSYTDCSGCFRSGPGNTAPSQYCSSLPPNSVATHDFFAKITQISDFFALPNFRKVGKFAASSECPKTKIGFAPWPPHQNPAGAFALRPLYRLALPRSPCGRAPWRNWELGNRHWQGAAKKYPLELSAIFRATAWSYNAKLYTFITV